MARRDSEGYPIRVRSRQFYATERDVLDFLHLVMEEIPESRFHTGKDIEEAKFPQISPDAWMAMDRRDRSDISILFHDDDWEPKFETYRMDRPEMLRLANLPSPSAALYGGVGIGTLYLEEVDRTIKRPGQGVLHTNDRKDDAWGKKIIDKVYRLSAKVFSNKAHWFDLVTCEMKSSVRYYNWYGRDLARLCREDENLFLALSMDHDHGEYWGLRPDL